MPRTYSAFGFQSTYYSLTRQPTYRPKHGKMKSLIYILPLNCVILHVLQLKCACMYPNMTYENALTQPYPHNTISEFCLAPPSDASKPGCKTKRLRPLTANERKPQKLPRQNAVPSTTDNNQAILREVNPVDTAQIKIEQPRKAIATVNELFPNQQEPDMTQLDTPHQPGASRRRDNENLRATATIGNDKHNGDITYSRQSTQPNKALRPLNLKRMTRTHHMSDNRRGKRGQPPYDHATNLHKPLRIHTAGASTPHPTSPRTAAKHTMRTRQT